MSCDHYCSVALSHGAWVGLTLHYVVVAFSDLTHLLFWMLKSTANSVFFL